MRRDILEIDTALSAAVHRPELNVADVEAIRLLLVGGSVVDWQRLNFKSRSEVDRQLGLLELDMDDPDDVDRLRYVFNESVSYLEEHLHLQFPRELRNPEDVRDVFLWASQWGGFRRTQILSCVILKLMHVIHHMEAADLKFKTAISEERFLEMAHRRILRAAREMQDSGLPVSSFYGSRKSRSSVITKLLAKSDTLAATIFDHLRFRVVVQHQEDLGPTLAWMTHNMFPFNYVIPGQSHNNLLDPATLLAGLTGDDLEIARQSAPPAMTGGGKNEFSGQSYRTINFIVDYPVKIPETHQSAVSFELGKVVFVMVEFQLLDEETARTNEEGDNAHVLYKQRQHLEVAKRLKRGGAQRRNE